MVSGDCPKISWFKDNYNISNNRYVVSEGYGGIRRLTIREPVPSDFGCYTCRSEENGHIDEISLTVSETTLSKSDRHSRAHRSQSKFHERPIARKSESCAPTTQTEHTDHHRDPKRKPVFTMNLTDRTAAENSSIKLTCQVIGVDTRTEWFRNGKRLEGNPRYASRYRDGLATLEVFCAKPDDSGEYTCTALNEFGETTCSSFLKVFAGHENRPMQPIFTRPMKGKGV